MVDDMYDAIIIGSGISGASLARELCRYRLRIAVLEKGEDICSGASKGNSATIHSGHDAAFGTKKAHYNVLGNAMYDRLCAELGVPFTRNGMIVLATDGREMNEVRCLKQNGALNGVPGLCVLDRDGLVHLEGYFGPEVIGGLYASTSGIVCPYGLVIAMCENAAENGVDFYRGTRAAHICREAGGYYILTNRGRLAARYVFNCAGTHADEINDMVSGQRFTIAPRKGEHLMLDRKLKPYVKATICQPPRRLPGGGHTKGMGIMPSTDGTIILGCDAHDVADKDEVTTTREGIGENMAYFKQNWRHLPISRAFPDFPVSMVITAFAGLRPHPDTDDFIIGEAEDAPGFYNVAGIESPGLTAAPAIAYELAQQAAERYGWERNQEFNPLRHPKKPFREMNDEERRKAIVRDPNYGKIVCRCEQVTKAEILAAIHAPVGAKTVNAVKMRTRAGMGRCQGGFCEPEIVRILSAQLGISMTDVTLRGEGSSIVPYDTCMEESCGHD